jgi:pimeloyl-ACP methyl ester carboxylesterase
MNTQLYIQNSRGQSSYDDVRSKLIRRIPVEERRFQLAGISTAVLEGGEGPPIVLLHGPGEFAAVWSRVIPDLVSTHRVIVPDLPGHGASDVGSHALTVDRVLDWLGELIGKTCPSPPVIVGHLLGGAIGIHFAIKYYNRLSHLILVDTFGLGRFRPTLTFARAMIGFIARPTERSQDRLFRQCFVDYDGLYRQMETEFDLLKSYALECARSKNLKRALRNLMPKFAMPVVPSRDIKQIGIPVTLIWGRHDRQVRLKIAEDASVRYGWPLHIIDNAADDPAVEQPEAFLKALYTSLTTGLTEYSADRRTPVNTVLIGG